MKQVRFTVFALFAAITLAFGLVLAQQDVEAVENVVRQLEERFGAGDTAGVAELYTEDATYYDALGQVHEGREAIEQYYQGNIDAGFTEASLETIETEVSNDTAYHIGRYVVMHDEVEPLEGYFMAILTRENGEWRLHRTVTNAVMPEPEVNN